MKMEFLLFLIILISKKKIKTETVFKRPYLILLHTKASATHIPYFKKNILLKTLYDEIYKALIWHENRNL